MSKHTKGPWIVEAFPEEGGDFAISAESGVFVAISIGGIPNEIANARLIAAAPELLEALEMCLKEILHIQSEIAMLARQENYLSAARNNAVLAIAKARGEA